MKTEFTKNTSNFGCYAENNNRQNDYLPNDEFTITDILSANVSLKHKAWFIRYNCEFTVDEFRQFAIGCALCVLPIYEDKYPNNKAPREAIQAAKDYLAGIITIDVLREKRETAAAYEAAAAEAAAEAAEAAYAAYAAYAAAEAAAADAKKTNGKAKYQELLLQFLKDFTTKKETV